MANAIPIEQRFWKHVKRGADRDCWPWTASRSGSGYGIVRLSNPRRMSVAHRVAYELTYGSGVPDGMVLMHSCDNKVCCNPLHLSIGTQKENVADCLAKGRNPDLRGELHPAASVTAEQVRGIRVEWQSWPKYRGAVRQFSIKHGLYYETMRAILTRRSWKHV